MNMQNPKDIADHANAALRLLQTVEEAMRSIGDTQAAAQVDANGEVSIDKEFVRDRAFESGAVRQRFDQIFDLLWEEVEDQITHSRRAQWSRDRAKQREEKQAVIHRLQDIKKELSDKQKPETQVQG